MPTESEVRTYLAASTRPRAECQGTVGNDMTGHFGSYPHQPGSATEAADSLEASGELYTTPCPADAHFDFYHFTENGVDLGHVDYHVGPLHYANSTRCTVWLNARRTVGTYSSWPRRGESRRGWSYRPASRDYMPPLSGLSTAGSDGKPLTNGTPSSRKKMTMLGFFSTPNTGTDKATYALVYHLVTEDGRDIQFRGGDDFAAKIAAQYGPVIATDTAFLASITAQAKAQAPATGTLGIDQKALQPLLDALAALGVKIDALPAQIDQYADGKKQS